MSGNDDKATMAKAISTSVAKSFAAIEKSLDAYLDSCASLVASVSDDFLDCTDSLFSSSSQIYFSANNLVNSAGYLQSTAGILAASASDLSSASIALAAQSQPKTSEDESGQKAKKDENQSGSWLGTLNDTYKETKSFIDTARDVYKEAKGAKDAWQGKGRYKGERPRGKRLLDWLLDRDPGIGGKENPVSDLGARDSGVQKVFVINWPDELGGGLNLEFEVDLDCGRKGGKGKGRRTKRPKGRGRRPGHSRGNTRSKPSKRRTRTSSRARGYGARRFGLGNQRRRPAVIDGATKRGSAYARNRSGISKSARSNQTAANIASKRADVASGISKKQPAIPKIGKAAGSVPKGGGFFSSLWKKATGLVGKIGGGKLLKSFAKKIPGVSLVMGGIGAVQRAMQGDWLGALGEVASGVAGMVPGIGTAVSTVIDGGLIARDMMAESAANSAETSQKQTSKKPPAIDRARAVNVSSRPTQAGPAQARAASKAAKGTAVSTAAKSGGGVFSDLWKKATGVAGKIGGGSLLKSFAKKIPGVSLVMGGIGAVQRAMQGDWLGALGEAASGVAGMVPGLGTVVSTAIDGGLIARDMMAEDKGRESPPGPGNGDQTSLYPHDGRSFSQDTHPAGGGFQVSINQVVNLAPGATAEGLENTLTQGRDRLRNEVETIVRDMFHRQRRVSFGSVSA